MMHATSEKKPNSRDFLIWPTPERYQELCPV
jgi:hypothetical protein